MAAILPEVEDVPDPRVAWQDFPVPNPGGCWTEVELATIVADGNGITNSFLSASQSTHTAGETSLLNPHEVHNHGRDGLAMAEGAVCTMADVAPSMGAQSTKSSSACCSLGGGSAKGSGSAGELPAGFPHGEVCTASGSLIPVAAGDSIAGNVATTGMDSAVILAGRASARTSPHGSCEMLSGSCGRSCNCKQSLPPLCIMSTH